MQMHGPNWYMRAFGCIFLCDRKHFKLFTSEFQFNAYILLNHLFNAIWWIMQCKSRNIEVFTRTTHTHNTKMAWPAFVCTKCTAESLVWIHKHRNTICFGLHIHIYRTRWRKEKHWNYWCCCGCCCFCWCSNITVWGNGNTHEKQKPNNSQNKYKTHESQKRINSIFNEFESIRSPNTSAILTADGKFLNW